MNDDQLIHRYLDGHLSAAELVSLNRRLREDAALREHLRLIAEQAVALGDLARRDTAAHMSATTLERKEPRRTAPSRATWLALAASFVFLAVSGWFFSASQPATVLALVESTGTVAWSNGAPIQPGQRLPAGTLETVGDASTAQFRFADGTLITLHGQTELTFSEDGQKILVLSQGTVSAQVMPQPKGRPMLVRTPSAVVEVVGTAFDLTARPEDTWLKVNEGMVKLKRLADGSQVEVPANRSAVASLQTDIQLAPAATPEPLKQWSFDFTTTTPPRDWRGFAKDGLMHASPYVARKHEDGRVTTHFGISIRTAMLPLPLRLMAANNCEFHFRLRQERPGALQVMLLTSRSSGEFGGNFECQIQAPELHPDPDGWCDLVVPLSRFRLVDPQAHMNRFQSDPAGNILTSVIINSFRENRRLALQRFELRTRP